MDSVSSNHAKKCGYVALLGRPNAGKSTLLNALVGQKIAGVSKKPQTTRNRILGVDTFDQTQCIYLDTPGVHRGGKKLINRSMNKAAWSVVSDADLICYLIDCKEELHAEDQSNLEQLLGQAEVPVLVLLSKTDSIKKQAVNERFRELHGKLQKTCQDLGKDIILPIEISSKRKESLQNLRKVFEHMLPEGNWHFGEDELTDRPQRFIVAEIIREQAFRQLAEEIPYGVTVQVEAYKEQGKMTRIQAAIIVERANHKGILIGKGGSRIKTIGSDARVALERHLDQKVFLELFVKVQENWTDRPDLIEEFQGVLDSTF